FQIKGWRSKRFFYPKGERPLVDSLEKQCLRMANRAQRRFTRRDLFFQAFTVLALFGLCKTASATPSGASFINVRTDGSDTLSGGWFDPSLATYATDGAATSATSGSPVFSSASYNFQARDVDAFLYLKSGTNAIPGYYRIASVAANSATLVATAGSAADIYGGPNQ